MPSWSSGIALRGNDGLSVLTGSGAPASTLGVQGQPYIDTQAGVLYVKASGGWPSSGISLVGPSGSQGAQGIQGVSGNTIRYGSSAPTSSTTGATGDFYLTTSAPITLYGPATGANTWPTSGTSLVGPQGPSGSSGTNGVNGTNGNSVRYGSGAPTSSTTGATGDFYINTANYTIYGPATGANTWPSSGTSLIGPMGSQGTAGVAGTNGNTIRNGANAPTSSTTGVAGDYYIATSTSTLYGPATGTNTWPTSGVSLIGPQGSQGTAGTSGTNGTNGNTIRNGVNAPTSSTTGVTGDYYLATSTTTLYGPATGTNTWPTTGVSLIGPQGSSGAAGAAGANGNTVRNGANAPTSSTTGVAGDFYIATSNYTIYGPATGTNTWPSTGTSLVGPQGATGASGSGSGSASTVGSSGLTFNDGTVQNTAFPGAIALGTTTATTGPSVWYNGGSLTSTAVLMQTTGATTTQYFQPPTASGFYGCLAVNYNTSAAAIYVQLYNQTDGAAVWTSPSSIAAGSVTNYGPFAISTYPMTANKQYVWRISGSGTTYANVIPQYFVPSATPYATQYPSPSMITTATTLSSTVYNCRLPGNNTLTQYYRFASGGFFTYASFTNYSTTTAAVFLLQNSAGTTIYTSPSVAAGATTTVGPFGPGAYYLAANTSYMWGVTGSGSATVLVNWAYVG